ncbi:MAG: NeuD/PglB/VioB family sugar acetyltransferase [Anaerolineales bacterium]|nr:NeuD/PglB/VioB family sugar acetyltransferase [Anaerolineales bacterium]
MTPQKLIILGTRTLAEEAADFISDMPEYQVEGFAENENKKIVRNKLNGLPIIWFEELKQLTNTHMAICALATTTRSRFTTQVTEIGMEFATIIHPSVFKSQTAIFGKGTLVAPKGVIGAHCKIGQHVWIGTGAIVGHHTEIGDHVTIQMGANVAGVSKIGNSTYIGMGANLIDHLNIGNHVVVGAGAAVVEDVPSRVLVAGVPAVIKKENINGK